jgi:hypothetical protein
MAKTKHFGDRLQQRGIRVKTVELARQYGIPDGDKGGVIVVELGETLITAYDFDSFNRY